MRLVLALSLALIGCGGNKPAPVNPASPPAADEAAPAPTPVEAAAPAEQAAPGAAPAAEATPAATTPAVPAPADSAPRRTRGAMPKGDKKATDPCAGGE